MDQEKLKEIKEVCTEKFLVPYESYAKKLPNGDCIAYPDPGPTGLPWTIGYGSTFDIDGSPIKEGDIWTHAKAIQVKSVVLDRFLNKLILYSPNLIDEPIYRIAGVLSWYYNLGEGNYSKSTFRKKIQEKDWMLAAVECLKWDKAQGKVLPGLTKRRQYEASQILNPSPDEL